MASVSDPLYAALRVRIDLGRSGLLPGWNWPQRIANRLASYPDADRGYRDLALSNHAGRSRWQAAHAHHRRLVDGGRRPGIRSYKEFLLSGCCRDYRSDKADRECSGTIPFD